MIPASEIKVIYTGNSKAIEFPFGFKFNDKSDIKVALRDIATEVMTVLTKDYFVDTVKSVVLYPGYQPGQEPPVNEQPEVLPSSKKIIIYRETPLNQTVDLGDKYPMAVVEGMDDKNLMIAQELKEKLDRCVAVDIGADIDPKKLIDSIFETAAKTELSAKDILTKATSYAETAELEKKAAVAAAMAAAESEDAAARSAARIFNAQGFTEDFYSKNTAGYYYTRATGQTNAPNNIENFLLMVAVADASSNLIHWATGLKTGQVYINICANGNWSGWQVFTDGATSIASAAVLSIGAILMKTIHVTGTVGITAFDSIKAGVRRLLIFDDSLTIYHSSNMIILPGANNVVVSSGDAMEFISEGAGKWRCINYFSSAGNSKVSKFVGEIKQYAGAIVPTGTLPCDGAAVSRSIYADLYAVIGTIYGPGDGSTTFNVPNMQGRMPLGAGGTKVLGTTGGEATHVLTIDELPAHGHTATTDAQGNHQHMTTVTTPAAFGSVGTGWTMALGNSGVSSSSLALTSAAGAHSHTVTAGNTGGGAAHNNMPPYITINYSIVY